MNVRSYKRLRSNHRWIGGAPNLKGAIQMAQRINAGPLPGSRKTPAQVPLEINPSIHHRLRRTSVHGADKLPGQGFDDSLYSTSGVRASYEGDGSDAVGDSVADNTTGE
jgi:hypothetical protein